MENKCQKKIIINENIGLVHLCIKKFVGKGIEYDDLFQAGSLGLVKAAAKFDYTKGLKFSTYAIPVILGEIKLLFREGGSIKVSRSLKSMAIRISRERESFFIKNGREPSINELSKILETTTEFITEAINSSSVPISLTIVDNKNSSGQIDIPTEEIEENLSECISLKQVISELQSFDRILIILRFFKKHTQSETAKILKTTQTQVSRREKIILSELRRKLL
ncbi:MAG: sigma-70 family RNA polymerase sigma factor [Oscillospiraceae bacterium]|jgi:RNA polymerase sporulation-specific sigma factor|nr:sigma-70 family RNA polymerase sigma factor [Oscillospiraceae bacterium]